MDNVGWSVTAVVVIGIIVMVAVAGFFVLRLLMKFRLVHSEMMPLGGRLAFWGALAYTLFPIDVLPDPFLLDDIGVLAAALIYINRLLQSAPAIGDAAGGDDLSTELLGE